MTESAATREIRFPDGLSPLPGAFTLERQGTSVHIVFPVAPTDDLRCIDMGPHAFLLYTQPGVNTWPSTISGFLFEHIADTPDPDHWQSIRAEVRRRFRLITPELAELLRVAEDFAASGQMVRHHGFLRPEAYYRLVLAVVQVICGVAECQFDPELVLACYEVWWNCMMRSPLEWPRHRQVAADYSRQLRALQSALAAV